MNVRCLRQTIALTLSPLERLAGAKSATAGSVQCAVCSVTSLGRADFIPWALEALQEPEPPCVSKVLRVPARSYDCTVILSAPHFSAYQKVATGSQSVQGLVTTAALMPHSGENGGVDPALTLGPMTWGKYHRSLDRTQQIAFIRHGEKSDQTEGKTSDLDKQGNVRAKNLYQVFGDAPGALLKPNVIYAMKQGKHEDNSNRPFETVSELAKKLGMDPQMDDDTTASGNIFNNRFTQKHRTDLVQDINSRADNNEFDGKTLLFCWEHKNIPYIVAELGLVPEGEVLTWGLDPKNGEDDSTNFTAVWMFNPSEKKLDVFQEFEVVPDSNGADGGYMVQPPAAGYKSAVWSTQFEPDTWIRKDDPRHKELKAQGLKH